ncbi:MAG: GGDEF domain-containing protein, partial [Pseudonocardia sp.]|nr:GGDEF domain-containing protein [Pseudonocardia sp.]
MEYERDTPEPTADRDRAAAVRRLAVAWTDVIEAGNYVSTSRAGLVSVLTEMAGQIVDVLDGRAAPASASAVGAALVDAHLTDPATLRCSIDVIGAPTGAGSRRSRRGGEDSADTKYSGEQVQQLVSALGALSSGYARALQNRTRAEQQRISSAAFSARGVAEAARWASEARYGAVFAHAVIGISVSDIDGTILEANQAMCRMLGYTPAELTGRSVDAFIHPDDPPETWAHVAEMTAGDRDHIRLEKLYYRKDRTQIWTELVVSLIRAPDSTPLYLVAMVEDVTERHELLAQLQQQADHDPLTGLPNRALFFRRLTAAL